MRHVGFAYASPHHHPRCSCLGASVLLMVRSLVVLFVSASGVSTLRVQVISLSPAVWFRCTSCCVFCGCVEASAPLLRRSMRIGFLSVAPFFEHSQTARNTVGVALGLYPASGFLGLSVGYKIWRAQNMVRSVLCNILQNIMQFTLPWGHPDHI